MSFQNLRQISERYAASGNRQDVDEFRSEMNRISRLQRFQTVERYINDLYTDYPYLVRDQQFQFVPVRNQRLTELIQLATSQQLEAYRLQAAEQAKALQDAKVRQDTASAAVVAAATTRQQAALVFPEISNNLAWLLIAAAALFVLLLILLIYMLWNTLNRPSPTITVVERNVDSDQDEADLSMSGSAQ